MIVVGLISMLIVLYVAALSQLLLSTFFVTEINRAKGSREGKDRRDRLWDSRFRGGKKEEKVHGTPAVAAISETHFRLMVAALAHVENPILHGAPAESGHARRWATKNACRVPIVITGIASSVIPRPPALRRATFDTSTALDRRDTSREYSSSFTTFTLRYQRLVSPRKYPVLSFREARDAFRPPNKAFPLQRVYQVARREQHRWSL